MRARWVSEGVGSAGMRGAELRLSNLLAALIPCLSSNHCRVPVNRITSKPLVVFRWQSDAPFALQASRTSCVLLRNFPCSIAQAKAFETEVMPVAGVLYFRCSEDVMRDRVCKRAQGRGMPVDDKTAADFVAGCMQKWSEIVEHYEAQGKVMMVDAGGSWRETASSVYKHFRELGHYIVDEDLSRLVGELPLRVLDWLMVVGQTLLESDDPKHRLLVTSTARYAALPTVGVPAWCRISQAPLKRNYVLGGGGGGRVSQGERWRAGHLFLTISHLCLFLPPPHQTIWSTFSSCLRIWPILCTQFMTMARVVVGSGGSDILCC